MPAKMHAAVTLPIVTGRLLIRSFIVDQDSGPMLRVYGDPEVMRFIPGGALSDIDAVRSSLETHVRAQERRGFSSWAVVERKTGLVIGDAGFGVFEPTDDIELGYTLARDWWGHGYGIEAAGACLVAGLTELEVPRIVAVVDAHNEASLRVAEGLGMSRIETVEAHGRRHILFAARR
jgi:RimJ/RimL family protein N-acetyltransferase